MIGNITPNINNSLYTQGVQRSTGTLSISESKNTQNVIKTDSYNPSSQAKLMDEISSYEKQLDSIFGIPKELSGSELKRAEALEDEIDKILGVDNIQLSKSDQKLMDKLDSKIEAILKDDDITIEKEKELNSLFKRQDSILSRYEEKELSAQDEEKVDALFKELDSLYGLKTPDDEQLLQAQDIYSNLFNASNQLDLLNEKSSFSYEEIAKLIKQQEKISVA